MHNGRYLNRRMRIDLIGQIYGRMGQLRSRHAMIGRSNTTEMCLGPSTFEALKGSLGRVILSVKPWMVPERKDISCRNDLGSIVCNE